MKYTPHTIDAFCSSGIACFREANGAMAVVVMNLDRTMSGHTRGP